MFPLDVNSLMDNDDDEDLLPFPFRFVPNDATHHEAAYANIFNDIDLRHSKVLPPSTKGVFGLSLANSAHCFFF